MRKEGILPGHLVSAGSAAAILGLVTLSAGCGGTGDGSGRVMEETGVIDSESPVDPNHGNLSYGSLTFGAERWDRVRVEVSTEGFVPLLKLVEVSTGAVLAEWDPEYPEGDALTYTIAGPGEYEARVYGTRGGSGSYTLRLTISPR